MLLSMLSHHPMEAILFIGLMPALAVALMSVMKPEQAAILTVWIAVFFAPEEAYIKLPSLPHIMKYNAPYVGVLIGGAIMCPRELLRGRPFSWPGSLVLVVCLAAVLTAMTNTDQQIVGGGDLGAVVVMPGLTANDGFYMSMKELFNAYFPFYVGFTFIRDRSSLRFACYALMSLLAIYAVLIMIELKMSPQMHTWIYGYAAHGDFQQTRRWGGWRPMVFMKHGLATALLVFVCNMAMMGLYRAKEKVRFFGGLIGENLQWKHVLWGGFILLFMTKSSGAIVYGILFLPLAAKAKPQTILKVALVLSLTALFYPVGRAYDVVPVKSVVNFVESISEERAESIKFRFTNENKLMEKARDRLWFGWGEYGRQFYYDFWGRMSTIPDGYWIILVGSRGVFGHLPAFLMLLYPSFMAIRRWRYVNSDKDLALLSCITLANAVAVTDLIPNGLFTNYPYFLSGALCALWFALGDPKKRHIKLAEEAPEEEPPPPPPPAGKKKGKFGFGKKKKKKKGRGAKPGPQAAHPGQYPPPPHGWGPPG